MPDQGPLPVRRPLRLRHYDYATAGAYFVTICTAGRASFFDGPAIRAIAEECWLAIPNHFDVAGLDAWVVMPNHVHGILTIGIDERADVQQSGAGEPWLSPTGDGDRAGARATERFSDTLFRRASLGTVVGGYKAAVTRACRTAGYRAFTWQRGYFEHVIRDEAELGRVRQYVSNNPLQWALDRENLAAPRRNADEPWQV